MQIIASFRAAFRCVVTILVGICRHEQVVVVVFLVDIYKIRRQPPRLRGRRYAMEQAEAMTGLVKFIVGNERASIPEDASQKAFATPITIGNEYNLTNCAINKDEL
jgi:hypothetical protein